MRTLLSDKKVLAEQTLSKVEVSRLIDTETMISEKEMRFLLSQEVNMSGAASEGKTEKYNSRLKGIFSAFNFKSK